MGGERNPSVSASPIHLPLRTDPPCGAPVFRSAYFPKKLSSFSPKRSTSRFASLTLRAHRGGIQYAVSLAPLACQGELSAQQTEGLLVLPTQKRKGSPSFLFLCKTCFTPPARSAPPPAAGSGSPRGSGARRTRRPPSIRQARQNQCSPARPRRNRSTPGRIFPFGSP